MDLKGRILAWNEGARGNYGYLAEEMVGKAGFQPFAHGARRRIRQGGGVLRYRLADPERPKGSSSGCAKIARALPPQFSLMLRRNAENTPVGYVLISRDITDRKRAEDRFHALLKRAVPDAMVMVNPDGRIVLVNAQTEKLFGYGREELLGNTVEMLVPQRFRAQHPQHRSVISPIPRCGEWSSGLELYGLRKDDTEFPMEISLSKIETENGSWCLARFATSANVNRQRTVSEQCSRRRRMRW